jgi:hypothetical protein
LNRPTLVSKIVIQHLSGRVSCNGKGGMSNFGCGNNLVALLLTQSKRQVLPSNNVHGYKKTAHRHSHWYTLSGVSKNSKTMTWRLKNTQMLKAGTYQLWYNEDLSNGTEGDNRGTAKYKVTVFGASSPMPRPRPRCKKLRCKAGRNCRFLRPVVKNGCKVSCGIKKCNKPKPKGKKCCKRFGKGKRKFKRCGYGPVFCKATPKPRGKRCCKKIRQKV